MKKFLKIQFFLTLSLIIISCNTGPKPIDYGNDGCQYCKMTIVDKIHGAEIVTEKGKVFKFDATECMLDYLEDNPQVTTGSFYTNHYESPANIIPAKEATFLVSQAIPSPMGANLSAFLNRNKAEEVQRKEGGTLYSWEELKKLKINK